jgi:hypothetical protein
MFSHWKNIPNDSSGYSGHIELDRTYARHFVNQHCSCGRTSYIRFRPANKWGSHDEATEQGNNPDA